MTDKARIVSIEIDEKSLAPAGPDAEHERKVAIFDLLEANHFKVVGHDGGPYNVVLSLAACAVAASVSAQAWPDKPVRILVPSPAGSSPDVLAPAIGEKLKEKFGQPMVAENKPARRVAGGTAEGRNHLPQGRLINCPVQPRINYQPIADPHHGGLNEPAHFRQPETTIQQCRNHHKRRQCRRQSTLRGDQKQRKRD